MERLDSKPEPAPSKALRIWVFVGLCAVYACLHLERQTLGILAESVKSELHLSDQALGALTGSAFSMVYALLGLIFGRVADRASRLRLVRIGAVVWSLSAIGAAFASGYATLVLARAGIATGEAVATAAAVSLMAEIAGDRNRAMASSVFFTGAFVGAGLAAICGGFFLEHFRDAFGDSAWRPAIALTGVPGLVGAAYLTFFRFPEPNRAHLPGNTVVEIAALCVAACGAVAVQVLLPPIWSVPAAVALAAGAGALWMQGLAASDRPAYESTLGQPAFRLLLGAFAAVLFVDFAASFWLLPYAQRRYGESAATVGAQLGALMIVGGIFGCLFGGWIADRLNRRMPAGRVWVAIVAVVFEAAAIWCALVQSDYTLFVAAFAAFCVASGGWTGVAAAIGLDMVPREHRGTGTAAYFLVTTVLGPGLGAFAVGLGSDVMGSVSQALSWSVAVMAIAVLLLFRLARR